MIRVISASAGTGKTHRLTEELAEALLSPTEPIRPEGVVAITYTRKAAAELQSRLRQRLMRANAWEAASRIRDGYLGTVHAVCDRLLREFALEAGLSPDLVPMTEPARKRLLAEALGDVLEHVAGRDLADDGEMTGILRRLRLEDGWRGALNRIVTAARANAMTPEQLAESGRRSWEGLRAVLRDEPEPEPTYLDELGHWLEVAEPAVDADSGRYRAAGARADSLATVLRDVRNGRMPPWGAQVTLARDLGEKKGFSAFGLPLAAVVERHVRHARFQADLERVVAWVFALAAEVLTAYEARKRAARLLDYDDMLAETLRLLDRPEVAEALRERIDLLLVDEFQDTSPIQLAIILRLADLAGRCAWVGDPKQAIYGFQGSDPELMRTAMEAVLEGEPPQVLGESWRSRPPLVELCSDIFKRAFSRWGFPPERVAIRPKRPDPPELVDMPVLDLWRWSHDRKRPEWPESHAVAEGVLRLIDKGVPVCERPAAVGDLPAVRAVRPGDVAVLMRTNKACRRVADALQQRGIKARVQQVGLMDQPEARLARAALAVLADKRAGVPAMEVAWIAGAAAGDPDGWLADHLDPPEVGYPFDDDPRVAALRSLADQVQGLSPSQAYERAVEVVQLVELCLGWPDGPRRVANLEALRAEVKSYEDLCAMERHAATIPGLLAHLDEQANPRDRYGDGDDAQAMPTDPEAVTVITWHKAKGLEWPVVVLGSLGERRPVSPFELQVEPADVFDPRAPLRGRWIRWWPNPYGNRWGVETVLHARATLTPEVKRAADRDEQERVRLLYVGFTRARDRLCLAVGTWRNETQDAWLADLRDSNGSPVLTLPLEVSPGLHDAMIGVGQEASLVPCRVRTVRYTQPDHVAELAVSGSRFVWPPPAPVPPAEVVHPSSVHLDEPARIEPAVAIGARMAVEARPGEWDRVGNAVHGFLAADVPPFEPAARVARATALLTAEGVPDAIAPSALLGAGDALRAWAERWPGAEWLREWPVRWRIETPSGPRLLVGEVDLVLDTGEGLVVVDHKSFPGTADDRDQRVQAYAGQLAAYGEALASAVGKPVIGTFVHFPVRGEVQQVHLPADAFARWLVGDAAAARSAAPTEDDPWLSAVAPAEAPPAEAAPAEDTAPVVLAPAAKPLPLERPPEPEHEEPLFRPAPPPPDRAPEHLPSRRQAPEVMPAEQLSLFGRRED